MKLIHRNEINWGWLVYLVLFFVILLDLFYFYNIYNIALIKPFSLLFLPLIFIVSIPLTILNILIFPVKKTLIQKIFKRSDLVLYTPGIKLRNKYFPWKEIKSISFKTGRYPGKKAFFRQTGFPVLQRIFVLDNEGREYSAIIDVDYSMKGKREKNNLRQLRELLIGMNHDSLISDWAEKFK